MPITFEQYIAQFEGLDKYGEYSERLKEELRDHFDDSVHSGLVMGKSEPSAKQTALKNLGESKIIIHEFKKIMIFNNKYALWMESLFLGIISIPIFQFLIFISLLFEWMYADDIGISLPFLGYVISYGICFFVLTIFYLFSIKRVFRFLEGKLTNIFFALGLFIPPFFFAFIFTDGITSDASLNEYLFYVFVPALLAFVGVMVFFNKKKESFFKKAQEKKQWQKILSWIPFFIAMMVIPLILLTNNGFVPMDSSINRSLIDSLTFFRSLFESINIPIIDFHYNGAFGGNEGFYLFGIIYLFLAGVSLYKIIGFFADKTRIKNIPNFSWLSMVLLVYIFSLFFLVKVPAGFNESNITWHVPVKNISDTMKKEQLGFLYTPILYLENFAYFRHKPFFLYEIKSHDNYFQVINPDNEGNPIAYYLGFPNVDDSFQDIIIDITGKSQGPLLGLELSAMEQKNMPFYHGSKEFPEGVNCKQIIGGSISYLENPDYTTYCHQLYYQDKLIYTQDHAEALYQFEIMKQYPQYALLKLHNDEERNQEVYLIDVSK